MSLERRVPLTRKTPMPRGKPLKKSATNLRRTPIQPGQPLARGGRLRPMSEKRQAETTAHAAVRAEVFARDGHTCRLAGVPLAGPCTSRLTVHHIRKAGQGGGYTPQNLISLCAQHNDWIETSHGQGPAHVWGLWARRGETLTLCWDRLRRAGIVTYDWNGEPA